MSGGRGETAGVGALAGFGVEPPSRRALAVKRGLDLLAAAALLPALLPLLLATALWIRLRHGAPVLQRSVAAGRGGAVFTLLRFNLPGAGGLLPVLPQLVNVLRGDMSLIGPRPEPPAAVANGGELLLQRNRLRPGLTGWAQINRGVAASRQERLDLDLWYVAHWSLRLDGYILLETLRALFRRGG